MPIAATASVNKARLGINGARMQLQSMAMYGSHGPYGESVLSFNPMTLTAYTGQIAPTVQGGNLVVYPLGMYGHCFTGEIGQVYSSFEPIGGLSSGHSIPSGGPDPGVYNYGDARMVMQPLTGSGSGLPAGYVFMFDDASVASDISHAPAEFLVVMDSTTNVATAITFEYLIGAEMNSEVVFLTTEELSLLLGADMSEVLRLITPTTVYNEQASVYRVNRLNGATTRYENFDFTNYMTIGQHNYGVNKNGVYLLQGGDDDSLPIQASVDFGKSNYGTSQHKKLISAYVGVESDGNLQFRVVDDTGAEYYYPVRDSAEMDVRRVDFGRGLRANFYTLQLFNEGGADFDIASLEVLYDVSNRRV